MWPSQLNTIMWHLPDTQNVQSIVKYLITVAQWIQFWVHPYQSARFVVMNIHCLVRLHSAIVWRRIVAFLSVDELVGKSVRIIDIVAASSPVLERKWSDESWSKSELNFRSTHLSVEPTWASTFKYFQILSNFNTENANLYIENLKSNRIFFKRL